MGGDSLTGEEMATFLRFEFSIFIVSDFFGLDAFRCERFGVKDGLCGSQEWVIVLFRLVHLKNVETRIQFVKEIGIPVRLFLCSSHP